MLNHTANNSEWIQHHPEACYNTDSLPKLWPAWLVDNVLTQMSAEIAFKKSEWLPSAPYVKTESDLDGIIAEAGRRI